MRIKEQGRWYVILNTNDISGLMAGKSLYSWIDENKQKLTFNITREAGDVE